MRGVTGVCCDRFLNPRLRNALLFSEPFLVRYASTKPNAPPLSEPSWHDVGSSLNFPRASVALRLARCISVAAQLCNPAGWESALAYTGIKWSL